MPAQCLGHRLDLARRNPLHVHLSQGADQRLLRALIARKQFGREPPHAILRHPQLQRAHPGVQQTAIVAAAVRHPRRSPLALLRADRLAHLRLERRLNLRFNRRTSEILVAGQQSFQVDNFPLPSPLVMVCTPSRVGDVEHHQHAMTLPVSAFLLNLQHIMPRCEGDAKAGVSQTCKMMGYSRDTSTGSRSCTTKAAS